MLLTGNYKNELNEVFIMFFERCATKHIAPDFSELASDSVALVL